MTLMRQNPRKFDNKLLKDYSESATGTAAALAANVVVGNAIMKTNPMLGVLLPFANVVAGFYIAKKYPYAGGAVVGATLGATFQALAAVISKDISLLANSPAQEREIRAALSGGEMAGLPENINYLLTGG